VPGSTYAGVAALPVDIERCELLPLVRDTSERSGGCVFMAVTLAAAREPRFSIPDRSRDRPTSPRERTGARLDGAQVDLRRRVRTG
jgi:hypothetical protein